MKKTLLFIAILFATAFGYSAQAEESHTVACTAGNLASLASSYLTTVTNLTVTGTIDARDFKTMRDAMPLLEVIDLSGSSVTAYTGYEGTFNSNFIYYPANEIPNSAFRIKSSSSSKISLTSFIYPSSVTAIGNMAFSGCSGLTGSLTIPSTVTIIGSGAFENCTGLTGSLTIPSSVVTIVSAAFSGCTGLTGSLTIPSTVTTIGYAAFEQCAGLTGSLTIPSSVTTIGDYTFYGCSGFTGSLTIPSSVTTIGIDAFKGCTGFTGPLTISSALTTIGESAFASCGFWFEVNLANPNYSSQEGVLFNSDKTTLIQCSKSKAGNYIIPSSVTTIGNYAFYLCTSITGSLTIPSKVSTIGKYAFYGCTGFTGSLTISSSVATIGSAAFQYCTGFTGSLTIPSSVTTIGPFVFLNCSGFTGSLTLPSSITTISSCAFLGCSGFTGSLIIPSSVTTIGDAAFRVCSGFTGSLTIPSSVVTIGTEAFYGCTGLNEALTIPSSITKIKSGAFSYCTGLTTINAYATTPINISASSNVFFDVNKTTCILHVPVGSKELYEVADQWKDFTNIVEGIPTSINKISSNSITLYPNPATSTITVSELGTLASDNALTLSITDISGNTLLAKFIEPTLNSATIDVSSLKSGAYVMIIQSSNGNVVKRFLKQ